MDAAVMWVFEVGFWVALSLGAGCFVVVAVGPANVDRAVGLDLGIVMLAVALSLFSGASGSGVYVDASLMLAILSFLVTVIIARLLDTRRPAS